jgi:hypothetical protein
MMDGQIDSKVDVPNRLLTAERGGGATPVAQ